MREKTNKKNNPIQASKDEMYLTMNGFYLVAVFASQAQTTQFMEKSTSNAGNRVAVFQHMKPFCFYIFKLVSRWHYSKILIQPQCLQHVMSQWNVKSL